MKNCPIIWVAPPPSKSHHQDDIIFLVGNPNLNLHLPLLLGGGTTLAQQSSYSAINTCQSGIPQTLPKRSHQVGTSFVCEPQWKIRIEDICNFPEHEHDEMKWKESWFFDSLSLSVSTPTLNHHHYHHPPPNNTKNKWFDWANWQIRMIWFQSYLYMGTNLETRSEKHMSHRIHGTNGIFTYMNGWFLW